MMLKLFDKNKTLIAYLQGCSNVKVESVLEMGGKVLTFALPKNNPVKIMNEFYIQTDKDEFTIKQIAPSGSMFNITAKLNLEDLEGSAWQSFDKKNVTAQSCAEAALVGTSWKCESFYSSKKRNISLINVSVYNIFEKIKEAFICEIKWDTINKIVYLIEDSGNDNGVRFIKGVNLIELNTTIDSYDFYTHILPIGENGLTIEGVNNGLNYLTNYQYSDKKKTLIWEDTNYTDALSLKEDAIYKLKELSKPRRAYKAKVIDFAKMQKGCELLEFAVGGIITLIDPDSEVEEKQKIVKTIEYCDHPEKNECEICNTTLSFAEMQKKLFSSAACVGNVTDGNGILIGPRVKGLPAGQIEGIDAYAVEKITNTEIENICR